MPLFRRHLSARSMGDARMRFARSHGEQPRYSPHAKLTRRLSEFSPSRCVSTEVAQHQDVSSMGSRDTSEVLFPCHRPGHCALHCPLVQAICDCMSCELVKGAHHGEPYNSSRTKVRVACSEHYLSHVVDQGNALPTPLFVQAMCNCSRCEFVMIRIMLRIMLSPAIVPASLVD